MNFALLGAGGYIAPRHLKAIKETNNNLLAALDPHDSVGILDQFFPEAHFFTEFERFDRFLEKLRKLRGQELSYISICSPNYLHDAHCRYALKAGAHAICEKPLVINPWNLESLRRAEIETGKKIYTVMQLRHHPTLVNLKKKVEESNEIHKVVMTYITPRGNWYAASWKGSEEKSGGIAVNIGIHLFDLLYWIFGDCKECNVHLSNITKMAGFLRLQKADVSWLLSIDPGDILKIGQREGFYSYRSIVIDGEEINFSDGFGELHTKVYQEILSGDGTGIDDADNSIQLAHLIRNTEISLPSKNETHPYLGK